MRIIQRLGSISFALVFPVALSTGAFAQTESPINVNSADASAHAKAIDGLTLKAHGPFESFDELVKVDGVGWSLLKANGLTRRPPKEFGDADTESGTAVSKARVGL